MDSGFSPPAPPARGSKRRRNPGSCALCKKKKIKCDRSLQPNGTCSNCVAFDVPCVFEARPNEKIFVNSKGSARVSSLENRLRQVESQLSELRRGGDHDYDEDLASIQDQTPPSIVNEILQNQESSVYIQNPELTTQAILQLAQYARSLEQELSRVTPQRKSTSPSISRLEESSEDEADDAVVHATEGSLVWEEILTDRFRNLVLFNNPKSYHAKGSCDLNLLTNLVKMRTAAENPPKGTMTPYFTSKRPEFWSTRPYDIPGRPVWRPAYKYPEDDLLDQLVSLYFFHVNSIIALLHFPTFQRDLKNKVHLTNHLFGGTVLMVCALGAVYSDDPRVFKEGAGPGSRGWKYYDEIHPIVAFQDHISIWELQVYCLSALFLSGSSPSSASWTVIGVGLRYAQELGVHRKRKGLVITTEYEHWKRAFWSLIVIDRITSCLIGRPCALADEEIDVDLPVECDDEYWDHPDPELAWKQPPSKPTVVTHFIQAIHLTRILLRATGTLYAVKKHKPQDMSRQDWLTQMVVDLDSELNSWRENLPAHLTYHSEEMDIHPYQQSVSLMSSYYLCQIQIHRCLMTPSSKPSGSAISSMLVCVNAARACCDIAVAQHQRGLWHLPHTQAAIFNAAMIILMNLYSSPSKSSSDTDRLQKAMKVLKDSEDRWRHAGRLWDILMELVPSSLKFLGLDGPTQAEKRSTLGLPNWIATGINEPSPLVSQDPLNEFAINTDPNPETFFGDPNLFGVDDWWSSYFSSIIPNNMQ